MSSSSDVKYLNSCVGVFTGFMHGSNLRKSDKEGQVETVAPSPCPSELALKSIPASGDGVRTKSLPPALVQVMLDRAWHPLLPCSLVCSGSTGT